DVSRVLPLVPGGVVDAREVEHAAVVVDLHPFVAQGADPQGGQVLDPLSVPGVVLVVTGDVVGAVGAAQFCERGGRVGQIGDVAVHQVTRDGHGVHPFDVDQVDDALGERSADDRSQMYVADEGDAAALDAGVQPAQGDRYPGDGRRSHGDAHAVTGQAHRHRARDQRRTTGQ